MDNLTQWFRLDLDDLKSLWTRKMNTTLVLTSSVILIVITYKFKKWISLRRYFKKRNIPAPSPTPLIGNFFSIIKNKMHNFDLQLINRYGKICGFYEFSNPVILTSDAKFIKNFTIKDFNTFTNRRIFDPLLFEPFDKFLSVLKDDEWKNVRAIVSTTFSSGKLKQMSKSVSKIIDNYNQYLEEQIKQNNGIISTKTFFGSFTLDVISSCCFGIEINSIKDTTNIFLTNLQKVFASAQVTNPRFLLLFLAPGISNYMVKKNLLEILPRAPLVFLSDLTNQIIDNRKNKIDRREDFIQNMIEHEENLQKDSADNKTDNVNNNKHLKKSLTNNEILSQAILFFLAGYETTATTLEWISFHLARNQHVQSKLMDEVDTVLDKYNGEVTYDSINEMKYMDMVIDETLRICPPVLRTDRVASSDYNYNGLKIDKGSIVTISIYAVHYDPEVYPNPEQFDPDRFSDENKRKRDNESFIPFGAGPRICIGMRFALIEIKLMLAKVLSKYRFETCAQTPDKVGFDSSGLARPEKPIFVKVSRR